MLISRNFVVLSSKLQRWALPILLSIFRYAILIGYRKNKKMKKWHCIHPFLKKTSFSWGKSTHPFSQSIPPPPRPNHPSCELWEGEGEINRGVGGCFFPHENDVFLCFCKVSEVSEYRVSNPGILKSIGVSVSDTGVEVLEDQVSDTEKSIGCHLC
jgi:hypothetical protein